jgi:hypothetical protein
MPVLLYYPKINAPRSVIYQALLYWDRLATVAPANSPERFLDDRMRQVHDTGLYTHLPAEHWPGHQPEALERALRLAAHLLGRFPADDLIPDVGPDSYLYTAKLSEDLCTELKRRGLASPDRDGITMRVSAATQLCLISAAARDIAARHGDRSGDHLQFYAHTDSTDAYRLAHEPFTRDYEPPSDLDDQFRGRGSYAHRMHQQMFPGRRAMPCWDLEIGSLLPVPSYEVDVNALIEFRERYGDERRRLMMAIDLLVRGLQRHFDQPEDVLRAVQRELEAALADLERAGNAARITWTRRSLTVSIALAASWAAQKLLPQAEWILGTIAGAAINIATNTSRPAYSREDSGFGIDTEDVSYLHRVGSALG